MDWEESAISTLHQRLEAVQRCVDKIIFPGLCGIPPEVDSSWPPLNKGIAYLTGGVDRFGSPIIYLPHNPDVVNVSCSEFQGVIKYLAASTKAAAADVGFVVVIDRRRDRWNSLAWALQNLASSFPGDLKTILAIRPSNFFHGTISSLAMRWQREELNCKVPIELVSTTHILISWIEKRDLVAELGGELSYSHEAWLTRRQLIEDLAEVLRAVVRECKTYSVDLINAQFPQDDVCDEVVALENNKSNKLMEEIESLIQEGKNVLEHSTWIENDGPNNGVVNTDLRDVQQFYSLILELKDAFVFFWTTYVSKRTEYLRLKSFEKDYKRVSTHISRLIQTLEKEIEGDDSERFEGHSEKSKAFANDGDLELCIRACSTGQNLMSEHPYAIDCIRPKCEELKRLSGCFSHLLTEKQQADDLIRETKKNIQEVNEWCARGMKLLSSQDLEEAKTPMGFKQTMDELVQFTSTYHDTKIDIKHEQLKTAEQGKAMKFYVKSLHNAIVNADVVLDLIEKRKASLALLPPSETLNPPSGATAPNLGEESILDCLPQRSQNLEAIQENTAVVHPILHNDISPGHGDHHKLRHVFKELRETEKKYVEELEEIVQGYGYAIDNPEMAQYLPDGLKENRKLLLGNLEEIFNLHRDKLLPEMIACEDDVCALSNLFISKKADFMLYCDYCHNSHRSKTLRKQIGEDHPFFVECQKRLFHRLPLSAYLLKPIQRITKYQLLLQQLQKYSPPTASDIMNEAVETMMEVVKEINDSMHQISITGYTENFSALGKLLMQGSFQVQVEYKKSKVKDLARSKFNKPLMRHFFLYENSLLICKRCLQADTSESDAEVTKSGVRAKSGWSNKSSDRENSYQFKRCMKTRRIVVTEIVKGSPNKFKISSPDEDGEITVTASSASIKQSWIKSLNECVRRQKKISSATNSPTRVRVKKKSTSDLPSATSVDVPKSSLRRSKTTREYKTNSKSVPEQKPLFDEKRKKVPRRAVSKCKSVEGCGAAAKRTEEVTFGNIHGVDASPCKSKDESTSSPKNQNFKRTESTFQQSFRGKKKLKSSKSSK